MIGNLNDVNRVIFAIQKLGSKRGAAQRRVVIQFLRGEVLLGSNPDFEEVIDFCARIGLVVVSGKGVKLTNLGQQLVLSNPDQVFELQPRQKAFLVRSCYLDGEMRRELRRLFRTFAVDEAQGSLVWSSVDSKPAGGLEWLREHLLQLGVLETAQHLVRVTTDYVTAISKFVDEGGDFTEEQMEEYLRDKRLVGNIAESFVVQYERDRLNRAGHSLEAACVQRISKVRVNAGFDICSYDGKSTDFAHDRFIEVKGSGKPSVRFVWTRNEMQRATRLGKSYWIYFVGGINRKRKLVTREPVLMCDPEKLFAQDARYKVQPHGNMLVESALAGRALPAPIAIPRAK